MSAVLAPQAKPAVEISSERMAAAGLRAFARIAEAWGLSVDEQLALLGQPPRSTFFAWRKHPDKAALSRDTLERLITRTPTLVVNLGRGAGQREDRYMHLLCGPVSAEQFASAAKPAIATSRGGLEARIEALEATVAALQAEVEQLRNR